MKHLIISIPKSGTHLIRAVYDNLGINRPSDYRFPFKNEAVLKEIGEEKVGKHLNSLPHGNRTHCHLVYSPMVHDLLTQHDFHFIFIKRDVRDIMVSWYNWLTDSERVKPGLSFDGFLKLPMTKKRISRIDGISGWMGVVPTISYEGMVSVKNDVVDTIKQDTGKPKYRIQQAIRAAKQEPIKTASNRRIINSSDVDWNSSPLADVYESLLKPINAKLGYTKDKVLSS